MKVGFIVNHPTQFEVPFYQYVAKHFANDTFKIFYLKKQEHQHYDPELKQEVKWGFDLFEHYPHVFLSSENGLSEFATTLQEAKFDLIIVNGYKNKYAGFAEICRQQNVKVALRLDTVLFNQPFWKIWLRKIILKKEYHKFDQFLVTGKVSKAYCSAMGIPDDQINLFSYCVDNEFFDLSNSPKSGYYKTIESKYCPNQEQVILSVAKFVGRESPWDILKAFVKLDRTDLSLVLIGDGVDKEALQDFANKHPKSKIYFPGYILYQNLPEYYRLSSIFIHAAKDEPWGVSVQEAIAGGCFVICSDKVGAAEDLLVQGKNGFTYHYGNDKQLAQFIAEGLNKPSELIKQTNRAILSNWNYDLMWAEICKSAVETGK